MIFYGFIVVLIIAFIVSFSRIGNPTTYPAYLEKILGVLIILFLISSIRKINYKLAKEKLVARKSSADEFFRLVKDVIASSILAVLTIIVAYLSIRELGYFALAIAVICAFLSVMVYLSHE